MEIVDVLGVSERHEWLRWVGDREPPEARSWVPVVSGIPVSDLKTHASELGARLVDLLGAGGIQARQRSYEFNAALSGVRSASGLVSFDDRVVTRVAVLVHYRDRERASRVTAERLLPFIVSWWAMRTTVLGAATDYGLVAALESAWPRAVTAWGAWMESYAAITDQLELDGLKAGVPRELVTAGIGRLRDSNTASLFEKLERTGGGVAKGLACSPTMRSSWLGKLEILEVSTRSWPWIRGTAPPMGEAGIEQRSIDLLGALEDSLVLLAYGNGEERELRASSAEVYALLHAARDDREWTMSEPDPIILPALTYDYRESLDSGEVLSRILGVAKHAFRLTRFYRALAPDGRELDPHDREQARRCLVAGAKCLRRAGQLPADTEDLLRIRNALVGARRYHRSLVLALSDRPDRRALAGTVKELKQRRRRRFSAR